MCPWICSLIAGLEALPGPGSAVGCLTHVLVGFSFSLLLVQEFLFPRITLAEVARLENGNDCGKRLDPFFFFNFSALYSKNFQTYGEGEGVSQ